MSAGAGLSARDRRTLLVGLAVCGLTVAVGRGLPALQEWESARVAAAVEIQARVARVEATAQLAEAMTSGAKRARAATERLDSLLLSGATPSEAGARLALLLGSYADSAGVRVVSTSIRADSAFVHGFCRTRVRLTATLDIEGLMSMLEDIEGGAVLLAVREVRIARSDAGAAGMGGGLLRMEMVVEALVRRSADVLERGP